MSDDVASLQDVVKTYHLGKNVKVEALRGVNLTVERGSLISIMGPSGCGKTTLLNMIGGLDNPTDGRIVLDGIDITHMGEGELARVRREKIGFIFQFFNLVPLLTALENVKLPMVFTGKFSNDEMEGRAKELLRLVGLEQRMHHRPFQMSGGEQQRVAIARSLVNDPTIVLADEPTGNIDQRTGLKIIQLIQDLNETLEQTCIIVTHDRAIARATRKSLYMVDGKILRQPRSQLLPTELNPSSLKVERRELLLAELKWLKTSLKSLEERKRELDKITYAKAKVRYAKVLQRLKAMIHEQQVEV